MQYIPPVFQKPPISIVIKEQSPWQTNTKQESKEYTVQELDTLTSIALAHGTSVERIWRANSQLADPNIIEVNQTLKIPSKDEVLPERPLPENQFHEVMNMVSPPSGGFSSGGNTYYWGQCVWYIKNVVPWVQNGWGNASDWKYTSGHTVSTVPAVGTVAWAVSYGHVALVIGVSGDTVQIREMNYQGVGVISERSAPISEFEYIYP